MGLRVQEVVGCYLLGALCGLFREVVVGVVSLRDATEQYGHDACRTTHIHSRGVKTMTPSDRLHCTGRLYHLDTRWHNPPTPVIIKIFSPLNALLPCNILSVNIICCTSATPSVFQSPSHLICITDRFTSLRIVYHHLA